MSKSIITVKVKPNAKKSEFLGYNEEKKLYMANVKAEPEKGKANMELIKLLSKAFNAKVRIIKGLKSKEKVVEIVKD